MTSNQQILSGQRDTKQPATLANFDSKQGSSRDAQPSGMASQRLVIPGEDPAGVDALAAAFDKVLRPSNIVEDCLVQHMTRSEWRRRRINRVEACLLRDRTRDHSAKLAVLAGHKAGMRRMYRQCFRALADFRAIQKRAPHLIDGDIPTATITTQRPAKP